MKLPSTREILGVFFRLHNKEKKTVREAATESVRQVQAIWVGKARIPVKPEQHSIKKLETLFQSWKYLKRLRTRKTPAQISKQEAFREALDNLFDIAHEKALQKIEIEEDRDFLLAQREKERRGIMTSEDTVLVKKEERADKRRLAGAKRKLKSMEECMASTSKVALLTSSSESDNTVESIESDEVVFTEGGSKPKRVRRGRRNLITPALAATLDRTKTTS